MMLYNTPKMLNTNSIDSRVMLRWLYDSEISDIRDIRYYELHVSRRNITESCGKYGYLLMVAPKELSTLVWIEIILRHITSIVGGSQKLYMLVDCAMLMLPCDLRLDGSAHYTIQISMVKLNRDVIKEKVIELDGSNNIKNISE